MDWIVENRKDADFFKRIDLSPVDVSYGHESESLMAEITDHNTALRQWEDRFKQLAADRTQINDTGIWHTESSTVIRAECDRIKSESWDVLVALQRLIEARETLLLQLMPHIAIILDNRCQDRDKAFAKAQRLTARGYRRYLAENPTRAQTLVDAEANDAEVVVTLDDQIRTWRDALEKVRTLRRANLYNNSLLKHRQHEMFSRLTS